MGLHKFEDRGGFMGFEILPIEDGDETKYDIITITSPLRWTPHKLPEKYFYDPEDTIPNSTLEIKAKSDGYPFMLNHTMQDTLDTDVNTSDILSITSSTVPLIET